MAPSLGPAPDVNGCLPAALCRPMMLPAMSSVHGWVSAQMVGLPRSLRGSRPRCNEVCLPSLVREPLCSRLVPGDEDMKRLEKLSVMLPADLADMVRTRVEAGEFASDSELVGEALRLWQERDADLDEAFEEVRAGIQRALADPRPSISDGEVRRSLEELYAATVKARGDAA
ncbi:MAG TPA: hypothetical protein VJR58_21935 [Vineibacter sp.]|nr:hypothetical protein [Vineibacter sp.]